jgi:hypothetical protein
MLIAKEKRRSNIAEYIIYMWHIEDLLRACNLDIDIVKQKVIDGYKADSATSLEITGWYESLIHMMRSEDIVARGHLQLVKNTINEMNELHQSLLQASDQFDYMKAYFEAKSNISAFQAKSNNTNASEIEICQEALYSLLLLKMSKKEISQSTLEAMDSFSKLLGLFSQKYKAWEDGSLTV